MKPTNKDSYQNEFFYYILRALHLAPEEFIKTVTNGDSCYEQLIYRWIRRLSDRGTNKEQALRIIYRARMLFMI